MSQAFYNRFLNLFAGFIILLFSSLFTVEFLIWHFSTSNSLIFYYCYCGSLTFTFIYSLKYYREFKDFKQDLYFLLPSQPNPKAEFISHPLEMEIEDKALQAALLYRNGCSFQEINNKLRLGREPIRAKRLVIKGLDKLLKFYNENNVKKVEAS